MESNTTDDLDELRAMLSSDVIEVWTESKEYPGKMINSAGRTIPAEKFKILWERMVMLNIESPDIT